MQSFKKHVAWIAGACAAPMLVGWQVSAESNRVTFPVLERLVHYTTVRRGNVTEHIMTTPDAIKAVKDGQPIPAGTHFVLVDFRENAVFRYFVMQKGDGWGGDYDAARKTGDWQFQWFKPDRTINMSENTARCQSCHQGQQGADYLFTGYRIPRFDGAPVE